MVRPAEVPADALAVGGRARRLVGRCVRGVDRALVLLAVVLCGCAPADARPTRIVLVTLDTLRWDSFVGSDDRATDMPRTAARTRDARVFRRHYAASSSTQPTHASLLTGLHPWEHGVVRNGVVLADGWSTVPERLAEAGWQTAAVVASFPLERRFGFEQGFGAYHDEFTRLGVGEWSDVDVPGRRFFSIADRVTARALDLLDGLDGPRQFLWVHYFDPHSPYGDSDPAGGVVDVTALTISMLGNGDDPDLPASIAAARAAYDRDVRFLDRSLARLLERLADDADGYDTHVLLVSDHGESFGEGGSLGHGLRLTESQIHVPLVLLSSRVAAGVCDVPTGSVDVAATLLALAGLPSGAARGRDLTSEELADARVAGMRRTFAEPFPEIRTDGRAHTLEGSRFYVVLGERTLTGGQEGVEANDGGSVDADVAERVRALFAAFDAQLQEAAAAELLDPEVQQALQRLGYTR